MHANFAPLDEGPSRAGGIAGYMQSLALEHLSLGHSVSALSCGSAYAPSVCGTRLGEPGWKLLEPWRGIDRLEIVNSPNLAPSLWQFGNAPAEGDCPELDRIFAEVLAEWVPDIVHFHSLEGLAASCVHIATTQSRVIMSLHNYHPFCPQVYLMRGRRSPCLDYRGGLACESCETPIDIEHERRRRAGLEQAGAPSIDPPPLPPVMRFEESGGATTELAELLKDGYAHWEPLENTPPPSVLAQVVRNSFGTRRAQMVCSLNSCDRVLAVSEFVRELAVSMGVRPELVQTKLIGTRAVKRLIQPERESDGVLRMVFLGFNNYYKGLPMLVDAIGLLDPALRRRIHLSAHGPGCPAISERAEAIRPSLAGLRLGGAYSRDQIPELLAGRDIGAVPSVWWDNGPQTLMEFQSHGLPVIASRLGGIPDRVTDGVNGLLFRGNDRADAARQITRLLTEPGLLDRLWKGVGGGESIADHAREVVDVYEQTLESSRRPKSDV